MTFVCPDPRANQALVLHPTLGTTYVPNSTTLYKIGACLGPEAEEGGYKAQVVFRSDDGGRLWKTVSTIVPWNHNGSRFNGEYPRGGEVALGALSGEAGEHSLLFVNRVATVHCPAHRNTYSNYTMACAPHDNFAHSVSEHSENVSLF